MESNINEMSCKELVELVTDYLERALSPLDSARFESHISKCDWCKLYIEQIELTVKSMGKLSESDIPARVQSELLEAFRTWKNS
ncbi:MAG: anti-sigma factor family protein [Candidatus Acidiferrales bacterium]